MVAELLCRSFLGGTCCLFFLGWMLVGYSVRRLVCWTIAAWTMYNARREARRWGKAIRSDVTLTSLEKSRTAKSLHDTCTGYGIEVDGEEFFVRAVAVPWRLPQLRKARTRIRALGSNLVQKRVGLGSGRHEYVRLNEFRQTGGGAGLIVRIVGVRQLRRG